MLSESFHHALEFGITPMSASESRFRGERDLEIVEAELFEDRIVGTFENTQEDAVSGPLFASAVCLDEEGSIVSHDITTVEVGSLAPGETVSFQVTLLSLTVTGQGCPAFLVTGYGYSR